ncbi:peptidoglycan DD-metalloendopeptidase family protein [Luteimonas endophytica]|uniref:peptidoglycan DD-metalloendopeptidase family protein n=1 Tax=Luteimonas endophytica TaxID=3042023 RepID=UPI002F3F8BBA
MNTRTARTGLPHLCGLLLVAALLTPIGAAAQTTVKYVHTDALGSVVAMTDASGAVVEGRREYEAYGQQLTPAVQDGPGYTGHVQDAATGLTYMQQRYYDPGIGGFLSVDPVTAYDQPLVAFNRYRYGNSNPYKFTDPDGRQSVLREAERHAQSVSVAPINPYTGPVLPTESGTVTSGYGERVHPVTGQVRLHNGTDFRAPVGAEIRSTQPGEVVSIASGGSGGNQIMVQNNDGSLSGYAHTAPAEGVSKGTRVEAGYPIGSSDGSGRITGPHLHYTYRPGTSDTPATTATKPVDPVQTQLKDREIEQR